MHDPRAIANMIIEEGQRTQKLVTNLALQKLLYFAHALFLVERKQPLVSGHFEAWKYGPVHPTAYQAFRSAGDQPITFRATAIDALTGERRPLPSLTDQIIARHIERILSSYGELSPGRLVDISHAKGAPWHFVVESAKATVSLGLRISDDVILERFKFHKVSVAAAPLVGEPGDDSPILARD
ncbi:type VI toxin-antitoxin system SocA family antitoxin [Hyphomicrobium sulfonivorans]|uniref:type VI toxin-antitoxin system SocA family antitoxin n=1 Tax=Hyphomicrobium sulfonivorans TaxID=121290 RepID=UPI00156E5BB3|nr:type II toxin-antitoxin system antitoxin SocA domain-containing protein [Hyphomicrobium sulfonivorans]MBI1648706.1 SocA family protein [Hyphomicrobium sulfonivorans]NSL70759.1 hypothetical protein [Hyphomicrobium sulfonivorans]